MEKPSTKKPMNVLKTMVFLKNFMKKLVIILHDALSVDDYIKEHTKYLEENEYLTIEKRIHKYWNEFRIYVSNQN